MNNTNKMNNAIELPIRLHYIWFKDYYTFHNQGINFSSKYNFSYNGSSKKLKVTSHQNEKYVDNFFGNNIDVTAIVGQNGAGKTSLLRFIQGLKIGDKIMEDCMIVWEKDSKFWAASYSSEGSNPTILPIVGNNAVNIDETHDVKPTEPIFPFSKDIRFIYMTEMFNMSQYEASRPGISSGDDMSFAAVLYRQSEYGDEKKHTLNPVTRYIHRITDWQLNFISNGAEYVKQFNINFPSNISISPNYDQDAFIKFYIALKTKDINKKKEYPNNDFELQAKKLSNKFFGNSKCIKDEFAKAIIMNIISSFESISDLINNKGFFLYRIIERSYSSGTDIWNSTIESLKEINGIIFDSDFPKYTISEYDSNTRRFHFEAKPYINFMIYLSELIRNMDLKEKYQNIVCISTSKMDKIYEFFNKYKKCISTVDFLSFSCGLSSGETLLLNQYGKLMHLFRKDNYGYFLPADTNSIVPAKNAVIMLDEAEISFHPEWQRRYFNVFLNFINQNIAKRGTHVQIIIATHSPIILSDIPKATPHN